VRRGQDPGAGFSSNPCICHVKSRFFVYNTRTLSIGRRVSDIVHPEHNETAIHRDSSLHITSYFMCTLSELSAICPQSSVMAASHSNPLTPPQQYYICMCVAFYFALAYEVRSRGGAGVAPCQREDEAQASYRCPTRLGERLACANVPPCLPENPVGRKPVSAVEHNKVKND
jgi:hypothetical protein